MMGRFYTYILVLCFSLLSVTVYASDAPVAGGEEKFNVKETVFHHVLESHDWHLLDIPQGNGHYAPVAIPLPWLIYNPNKGIDFFFLTGHTDEEKNAVAKPLGYELHHGKIAALDQANIIDLSPSKSVVQMILVAALLFFIMRSVAQAYEKNKGQAPKGLQSFFEPIILFVRDDIAVPNLHGKHERFVPYLLTLFFFIWFANILGLTPLSSNIAGNISVSAALATLTFFIVQFNGTSDYWQHIFWYPGVPLPVKFLMLPVEVVGMFTKPISLCIRLFANIAAGHFMVVSLICLIFILGNAGKNPGGAFGIMPLSLLFTLFIMTLEVLVAAIQAYVFTLLTAVFIGQAMETHHHDDHHGHESSKVQALLDNAKH